MLRSTSIIPFSNQLTTWRPWAASQSAVEMPSGRGPYRGPGTTSFPSRRRFPLLLLLLLECGSSSRAETQAAQLLFCNTMLLLLLLLLTWERELVGKLWGFPRDGGVACAGAYCIYAALAYVRACACIYIVC